jgi:hypothetical protein
MIELSVKDLQMPQWHGRSPHLSRGEAVGLVMLSPANAPTNDLTNAA